MKIVLRQFKTCYWPPHGLGLGAVWCGLYSRQHLVDAMSETLNIPEHIIPIGLVVVGVKAQDRNPKEQV